VRYQNKKKELQSRSSCSSFLLIDLADIFDATK